jgi:chromate transporter
MEQELVVQRKWLSHEHFLDLVGATNLIPGPNSTELAMHIGYEQAGWKGLFLAGLAFLLPAALISGFLAVLYATFGQLPDVQPFLYGIPPAVIALVIKALVPLGKKAIKTWELALLATLALLACLAGVHEIIALFTAGLIGLLYYAARHNGTTCVWVPFFFLQALPPAFQSEWLRILAIFLKVGALLYGSGYVLFAFLDAELVATGMLQRSVLVDAIAVGQFTPGPVLSSATFIGYQLGGIAGAIAATVGIFLPSFVFVILLNPWIPRMRKSKPMSAFLDAVNAASIALILAVVIEMGKDSLQNPRLAAIALMSIALTLIWKAMPAWLLVGFGALAGYLLLQI